MPNIAILNQETIDKIAACVILQSYLDYIANNNAGEQ
jgi:RNase H-fold protein (predicted Holliday junction resolvase)